jgi:hypothetical protein
MAIVGIGAGIADYLFRSGILAADDLIGDRGRDIDHPAPSLIASCKGADRSPTLRESTGTFRHRSAEAFPLFPVDTRGGHDLGPWSGGNRVGPTKHHSVKSLSLSSSAVQHAGERSRPALLLTRFLGIDAPPKT